MFQLLSSLYCRLIDKVSWKKKKGQIASIDSLRTMALARNPLTRFAVRAVPLSRKNRGRESNHRGRENRTSTKHHSHITVCHFLGECLRERTPQSSVDGIGETRTAKKSGNHKCPIPAPSQCLRVRLTLNPSLK